MEKRLPAQVLGCRSVSFAEKGKSNFRNFLSLIFFTVLASQGFAQFTAGNLVVQRVGNGSSTLGTGAATVSYLEYTPAGTLVSTSPAPSAGTTVPAAAPFNLMEAGNGTAHSLLCRSYDGTILALPGYNAISTTTGVTGTSSATIGRTLGNINQSRTISTPTILNAVGTQSARAVTTDGIQYWYATSGGIYYLANATATPVTLSNATVRFIAIFNGQLYYATASGVFALGTGLPTSGTPTATQLSGVTLGSDIMGFSINPAGNAIIVADGAPAQGIKKFTLSGGTWSLATTIIGTAGYRGLTVDWTTSPATVYAVLANGTVLHRLADQASATPTVVATAGTNFTFRGVAFAPVSATSSVAVSTQHPAAANVNQGSVDYIVGIYKLDATTASTAITSFSVNTAGTYTASDVANFKFWTNSTASLTGATQFGTTLSAAGSGSTLSVTGAFSPITMATTRFLIVTSSVSGSATVGNTISLASTATSNLGTVNSATITGTAGASNAHTIVSVPPTIALSNASGAATNIPQNTSNAMLRAIQMDVTVANATLNAATFTTGGTYTVADIQTNGFRLYFNTSNTLTGATLLGSAAAVGTGGTISFTGLTQVAPIGTSYLIVTGSAAFNATAGNTISINDTPFSSLVFASGSLTGTDPVTAGNTHTFQASVPAITITRQSPSAPANVAIPSTNTTIMQLSLAVATNSTTLNSVQFTTGGTYTLNDISGTMRLWYNTSNTFGTATQIATATSVATGNTVTFSGLSQFIAAGTTGFVWLTVDCLNGSGRTINVAAVPFANVVFSQGTYVGVSPTAVGSTLTFQGTPTITEVMMPQYMATGVGNVRLSTVYRLKLSYLVPNGTYRYFNTAVLASDLPTSNGVGVPVYMNASGNFTRGSASLSSAGAFSTFTADANGEYTGWYAMEPSANANFTPGNDVFFRIALNDGGAGTTIVNRVTTPSSVRVIALAGTSTDGTGIYNTTFGSTAKNIIALYDNVSGTGRPLSMSWVESDGLSQVTNFAGFYGTNVDGLAGVWGAVIPNNNANGVRRIEQLALSNAATVGCPFTDADGVFGAVSTVNPTGGLTALNLPSIDFTTPTWYQDSDNDGFGNPLVFLTQCAQPVGYVSNNTDCNDANAAIYPNPDTDGDGYTLCTGDCNEGNAAINPGAAEICDGIDNNCNVSIDETPPSWYLDNDGDGFGAGAVMFTQCASPGAGYVANNGDCDDSNSSITFLLWYQDADGDGYGTGVFLNQCSQPAGYYLAANLTATNGDCDDSNAALNPATIWYQDADGDTFGNPSSTQASCTQPLGFVANSLDCNDANANIKPGATEISCNGIDENCDAAIDENSLAGCTDPNATNYNSSFNCEDGSCTYLDSFTPGNLVVSRVGLSVAEDALDGAGTNAANYNTTASLAGNTAAQQLVIDQFNTTSTSQLPVSSYRIPKAGTSVLTSSGSVQSEGQLTRALDGSAIYMTGFAGYAGRSAIAQTSSAAVARVVGRLGINYTYSRVASTSTLYSGSTGNNQNMRSAITDGTNWWAAGSNNGVSVLTGTQQQIASDLSNFRNVSIVNGQLFASTAFNITTPSVIDRGIYQIGTGLPSSAGQTLTPIITDPTNLMSPYGFQFNADQTICYIADDRTTGGGIHRYDKVGSTWTLTRTMAVGTITQPLGATGLYVDFYSASTPTVYAIASNGGSITRLVKFNDTGTSTPALTILASAPTNTAFRSVALAPCTDVAWYRDADGDGFGDATDVIMFCTQPLGYVSNNTDCNDADNLEFPGQVWYADLDNDGFSSGASLTQCSRPVNYKIASELTAITGDCNDNNAAVNPAAIEVCNGIDDDCDTQIDANQLTITTSYSGVGVISPAGPAVFACGDNQTFVFTSDPCYTITDVKIDGVSVGVVNVYTFTGLSSDHDIDVTFTRNSFTVTVNTTGLGSVTGPSTVLCGANAGYTVSADDCYTIESITVNGNTVLAPGNGFALYALGLSNVTENQIVDVVFSQVEYNLTATVTNPAGTSATISPEGTITRLCGTSQTYTISLGDCTELINVRVNGNDLGPLSTFTVDDIRRSYSISFQVQRITNTIVATSNIGGAISPGGTQTYFCGTSPTYTIVPFAGYGIAGVTVDGVPVGAITSYTFDNLNADHTIEATFALQPVVNNWNSPQSLITPNFPSCVNNSFTLAGCTESSQSVYYPAPVGAGQDAWFRFRVPTTGTGVMRISAGSTVNDLAIILQKEESSSPFYSQVATENARTGVGSEFMTLTNLIPGAYYRIGIKNMGLQTAGAFTMCVSAVRPMTCGTSTSPTNGASICDVFNGAFTGATSYTYTFTNQANPAETFSRNLNGISGGPAPTAMPLGSIPGLRYGSAYDVKIDATYSFTNGNGTTTQYTVTGNPQTCVLYTRTQPTSELSAADRCSNGPKLKSSVISAGWVCGAVDFVWELTPTTGLPIPYLTNRGIGDRFMRVSSLNGINSGATTFNVRVRPRFSNGAGGFIEGTFGPTQQLCIITPAMSEYQGEEEASLKSMEGTMEVVIYPNPNSGDAFVIEANDLSGSTLRVRILDITGTLVWSNQYSTTDVFSTNVILDRELANGLYMVEMTSGNTTHTERMVVSK